MIKDASVLFLKHQLTNMKTMVVALSVLEYYVIINLFVFIPQNFCVKGLELFSSYLFKDILELYDWHLKGNFYFQNNNNNKTTLGNRPVFCTGEWPQNNSQMLY